MKAQIPFALLCAAAVLVAAAGCASVEPWQKKNFARPHMLFDPDPLEARMMRHVHDSKEAASGGYGVGGGGCGCN
jgi:hypothetical protein